MNIDRLPGRREAGRLDLGDDVVSAAGRRHFGADDVDWRLAAGLDCGLLCRKRQARCAFGRGCVVERCGLSGTTHRGIEMNLAETSGYIGRDHFFGLLHRLAGMLSAPGIWPKVVAAEDDPFERKLFFCGDAPDQTGKIAGQHAGIAAELVDLVAGRFDHQRVGESCRVARRGPDDKRMRGADRRDTCRRAIAA